MNLDQYAINRGMLQVMQIKCFLDSIDSIHGHMSEPRVLVTA